MKRLWLLVTLTAAMVLGGTSALADAPTARCHRFCITVVPDRGEVGQVFLIRGRSWLPRKEIRAFYGVPCFTGVACPTSGKVTRFKPDRRGRFTFYFENGPGTCALKGIGAPTGFGKAPITFRQIGQRKLVSRTAELEIEDQ